MNIQEIVARKIRIKKDYNPFSSSFRSENIDSYIDELTVLLEQTVDESEKKAIKRACDTCSYCKTLHKLYDTFYKKMQTSFFEANLSFNELFSLLFAVCNRDFIFIHQQYIENIDKLSKNIYLFHEIAHFHLISSEDTNEKMDAQSVMEGEVDSFNIILNYLRYFKDSNFICNIEKEPSDSIFLIKYMSFDAQFYYCNKYAFEDVIWSNGGVIKHKDSSIELYYKDIYESKILCACKSLMEEQIQGKKYKILKRLEWYNEINHFYNKRKRLKSISVTNGYINYKLADGIDKLAYQISFDMEATLYCYYDFVIREDFPNNLELNITKCLCLFASIVRLIIESKEQKMNIGVTNKKSFEKFPYRIKKNDLVTYLEQRTIITKKTIHAFLEYLESNMDSVANIWNKPLYLYNNDYYFFIAPIVNAQYLNLIDCWFEYGGLNLEIRGTMFEKYLKNRILNISRNNPYKIEVIERKKFSIKNGREEQIDLLIKLRNVILVCELKCVRYPMSVSANYNCRSVLNIASKQAIRKTDFLKRNANNFTETSGSTTGIKWLPLVITNYPILTGLEIENVCIIDFHAFLGYFLSSYYTLKEMETGRVIAYKYNYKNEFDFNANIEHFLKMPPNLEFALKMIDIEKERLSYKDDEPEVYVRIANFTTSTFDISNEDITFVSIEDDNHNAE